MHRWFVALALMAIGWVVPVCAGTITAPELQPGRHVYMVPGDFDPSRVDRSKISQPEVQEIEDAISKLHFPFYVVLVKKLPVDPDADKDEITAVTEAAVDGLAEDWTKYPSFNRAKSTIFLLSYQPRKYALLAGTKWSTELGFEKKGAHERYTNKFLEYAKRNDPKTGIITMMQAIDNYIDDQTDPVKVKARQEAEAKRQAAEAKRIAEEERLAAIERKERARLAEIERKERLHNEARGSLDREIERRHALLGQTAYLPSDVTAYRADLEKAAAIRKQDQPQPMLAEAARLQSSSNALEAVVTEKRNAEIARINKATATTLAGVLLGIVILVLLLWWAIKYVTLRDELTDDFANWDTKIQNAGQQYLTFYEEVDDLVGVENLTGATGILFKRVTGEIDAIWLAVEAMATHLRESKTLAAKGNWFNRKPLLEASAKLDAPFTFETGKMDTSRLFGPPAERLEIKPGAFESDLERRFSVSREDWAKLKKALPLRFESPETLFSSNPLDTMLATATKLGIPHRRLSRHPLFGDDAADKAFYDTLSEGRMQDPLAYAERIEVARALEDEIEGEFDRLVMVVQNVAHARLDTVPTVGATVLPPKDDPKVSFDAAKRADDQLAGLLAGDAALDAIELHADKVIALYSQTREQAATANKAIEEAQGVIASVSKSIVTAQGQEEGAKGRLAAARRIHVRVPDAMLANGQSFLTTAQKELAKAREYLAENRHLESRSRGWNAREQVEQASKQFTGCIDQCNQLDEQKAQFEAKAQQMGSLYEESQSRIRRYNGSTRSLSAYQQPSIAGVADYALLYSQLSQVEEDWQAKARQAERAYEAEQERQRQAEAAQRRREEEARREQARQEEASRRSSYSSSSDSWGSSSSSSSSGSWGDSGGSSSSSASSGDW